MQEFNLPLGEYCTKGLAPNKDVSLNAPVLEECVGLRPSPMGLISPTAMTAMISGSPEVSYHAPQLIPGVGWIDGDNIVRSLSTNEELYSIYSTAGVKYTPPAVASIDPWHSAVFGPIHFLANDEHFWFRVKHIYEAAPGVKAWRAFNGTGVRAKAVCANQDMLVMGNFTDGGSGYLASARWLEVWNHWRSTTATASVILDETVAGEETVFYSTPGGGAYDYPFAAELAMLGYPNSAAYETWRGHFLQLMGQGALGFVQTGDSVVALKRLGNDTVVYGKNRVGLLARGQDGRIQYTKLLDLGLAYRGAVTGTDMLHVFVDAQGKIWRWQNGAAPQPVGYENHLAEKPITQMHYDPTEDEVFINTLVEGVHASYTVSPGGVSQTDGIRYAVTRTGTRLYGNSTDPGMGFSIITAPFDMQRRGLKKLSCLEVACDGIIGLAVRIHFRYGPSETWRTTGLIQMGTRAYAYVPVAAVEFKVELTGERMHYLSRLEYLNLRWQDSSKQHLRGLSNV